MHAGEYEAFSTPMHIQFDPAEYAKFAHNFIASRHGQETV
jgi:hypothetical protein